MTIVSQHQNMQSIHSIPLSQILRPQMSGGKVAVSVADYSVYAKYKHINVTPTTAHSPGYSSSRLRVLDTMIDQLLHTKERFKEGGATAPRNVEGIDMLIDQYVQKQRSISSLEMLTDVQSTNFGVHESRNGTFLDFRI